MKKILVCASSEKNTEALSSLLQDLVSAEIFAAESPEKAYLQLVQEPETDLVIVLSPLKHEQGSALALGIVEKHGIPVLLVADQQTAERSECVLSRQGITVVTRPVDKKVFAGAVQALLSAGSLIRSLRSRSAQLQDKLDEMRLVNRAKAMLISNLRMTEAQAHRYIEKQAMDLRQSRRSIAQNILKTYYNR